VAEGNAIVGSEWRSAILARKNNSLKAVNASSSRLVSNASHKRTNRWVRSNDGQRIVLLRQKCRRLHLRPLPASGERAATDVLQAQSGEGLQLPPHPTEFVEMPSCPVPASGARAQ